jgi:hypothetical protein
MENLTITVNSLINHVNNLIYVPMQ